MRQSDIVAVKRKHIFNDKELGRASGVCTCPAIKTDHEGGWMLAMAGGICLPTDQSTFNSGPDVILPSETPLILLIKSQDEKKHGLDGSARFICRAPIGFLFRPRYFQLLSS